MRLSGKNNIVGTCPLYYNTFTQLKTTGQPGLKPIISTLKTLIIFPLTPTTGDFPPS